MNGWPVWLASISQRRADGRIVGAYRWDTDKIADMERRLRAALVGVGDDSRERLFRMNVTLCLHRAVSEVEYDKTGRDFMDGACNLAGPPVASLKVKGFTPTASIDPCDNPKRRLPETLSYDPNLWIPVECGKCPSCVARSGLEGENA